MITKAVRIHGKKDLRMDEVLLPEVGPDDVRVRIISDSVCMSTYKAALEGEDHKRVPNDVAEHPIVIGHEFCGDIIAVGENWKHRYKAGDKFSIQPAHFYKGSQMAPGYSYSYCGGSAQYANIPIETLLADCLLPYRSDAYFYGSVAEPMSCIIGAFHAQYHTKAGSYVHEMGIREGGKLAVIAGLGPMGLGAIDYALGCDRKPGLLVVTSTKNELIRRARSIFPEEYAASQGVKLVYVNTKEQPDAAAHLLELTEGTGYDDVFCMAPVRHLVELSDRILGRDGCLNVFAGPTDPQFSAPFNFYNVHYASTHVVGTSGGNTEDMKEAIRLMNEGRINPASMITHVGGLNAVVDTVLNLPNIPGGKKLIYNHIDLPLTAIADFEQAGKTDPLFAQLDKICKAHRGLWNPEAEAYLLANAKAIGN